MQPQRSRQSARGFAERPYKLYAVNFHGSSLKPIRDQYMRQVKTGLRRKVFVIDVEDEVAQNKEAASRIAKEAGFKKRGEHQVDVLAITLGAIQRCQFEYDTTQRLIEKETTFDLTGYWAKELAGQQGGKTAKPTPAKATPAKATPAKATKRPSNEKCPPLQVQEHNIVGKPRKVSRRKYIMDEPEYSKNFIVLIGNLGNKLLLDLLQRQEPLQAIIHFLPGECGYDILLPHPETKLFVQQTLEEIEARNYELRQRSSSKPTGIFKHELPVISRCLAEKLAPEIFDQLSWCIFDAEVMYRRYLIFYVKRFEETDVEMPKTASVKQMQHTAESLSLQGHFLQSPVPAVACDITTIAMYLESLINTMGKPDDLVTESQMLLLCTPTCQSGVFTRVSELVTQYHSAFCSIMKIPLFERIIIEDPNKLLASLVAHTEDKNFRNIFLTCLEYNILRRYSTASFIPQNLPYRSCDPDPCEPFYLPCYVKFFATESAVVQNLHHWLVAYDQCDITELFPGCKLYHFKNSFNEVIEEEEMKIIPTRLCFRDFTLFLMDDFTDDFEAMELYLAQNEEDTTADQRFRELVKIKPLDFDQIIFVRPNSLSARQAQKALEKAKNDGETKEIRPQQSRSYMNVHRYTVASKTGENPHLKGYNLEDTRQEITVKTSKFHFDEGKLLLYEERWCFTDMNKTLHMKINRCKLYLARPSKRKKGISPNIRFSVNKTVSMRVLNTASECAKVIINYPNGLSIYHHDTYAEQVWYPQETFNHERRRIYTPHGAVIVHFNDDDLILIMRYNGEVYRLYQYEFAQEEEEMMDEDGSSRVSSKSRAHSLRKSKSGSKEGSKEGKKDKGAKSHRDDPKDKLKLRASTASKAKSKTDTISSSQVYTSSSFEDKAKAMRQALTGHIKYELSYLTFMCEYYDLRYLHLTVTTSTGNITHITHKGRVYPGRSKPAVEWQDYYANECYAMRNDGVRMIWTKNTLKCYHKDGTLITTQTVEGTQDFQYELDISQSSSHEGSEAVMQESKKRKSRKSEPVHKATPNANVDAAGDKAETGRASIVQQSQLTFKSFLLSDEGGEEGEREDTSFVTYNCDSFLMQHIHYAEVYARITDALFNAISIEITAIPDIRVQVIKELPFDDFLVNDVDLSEGPQPVALNSSRLSDKTAKSAPGDGSTLAPSSQHQSKIFSELLDPLAADIKELAKFTIKISVGDDLTFLITDEDFLIDAILRRPDPEEGVVREPVSFRLRFDANIVEVFRELVENITQFKNVLNPMSKEFYFLERTKANCEVQGFKFFNRLPVPSKYNFTASNVFTELHEVKTVNENMMNDYPWFDVDEKKFPRFRPRQKPSKDPKLDFPLVLAATTYIQIPRLLARSTEMEKFLEPFDNITFKRTRYHVKDALEYYMRPFIRNQLAKLWSNNNWMHQQLAHRQRLFRMQQRRGLYQAMLKHKVYPKYHQFVNTFDSHVKNIDFFDFVSSRCEVKDLPDEFHEQLAAVRSGHSRHSRHSRHGHDMKSASHHTTSHHTTSQHTLGTVQSRLIRDQHY